MKSSLVVVLFAFIFTTTCQAYNPSVNTTIIPYQVFVADSDIEIQAEYLGELTGDPQMYEFTTGVSTTLKLRISQLVTNKPIPFSLIAVKQNNKNAGVVEIGRLRAKDIEWVEEKDKVIGLSLLNSSVFEAEIGPGIYRVEVSTPENFGLYQLTIGDQPTTPGYFRTLKDIRTIQKFFGKSIFSMFGSTYVYYPLGIILLLVLMLLTWRKRDLIRKKYA